MKQRILVAVVGVPLLLAILVAAPDWATVVLVCLLSIVAAYEMLAAEGGPDMARHWTGLAGLMAVCTVLTVYWQDERFASLSLALLGRGAVLALLLALCVTSVIRYDKGKAITLADILVIALCGVVIPLALSSLVGLRLLEGGQALVLVPLVAAFCSDTMALFAGMLFGRRKLAPRVSPKKTIEGSVGGLLGGVAGMAIFRWIYQLCTHQGLPLLWCLLIGLLGAAMGQLGDLFFSLIKRQYGIKDYGHLLPGHGGVLDRFDSVIFAAPVVWLILSGISL
jgi:phosphatidate cytidylyltransferase